MNVWILWDTYFILTFTLKLCAVSTDPVTKYMFSDANDTIEKWTKFGYMAFMKVMLPLAAAAVLILPYYSYYNTESGREAFTLYAFLK